MATYTVVKGDCLWSIALNKLGDSSRWSAIAAINNIKSPYTIYPGQQLTLPDGSGGSTSSTTSTRAKNIYLGTIAGIDGTLFAGWSWKDNPPKTTKEYKVKWYYDTGIGRWLVGEESSITISDEDHLYDYKYSLYKVPENAVRVKFIVKPISKTYKRKSGNSEIDVEHWTADWSKEEIYDTGSMTLPVPSAPSISIEDYTLTAELSNLDLGRAKQIEFQIAKDNEYIFNTERIISNINTTTNHASCSYTVEAGHKYTVRARSVCDNYISDWSAYSEEKWSVPSIPQSITMCKTIPGSTISDIRVRLEWTAVFNADSYSIEYTTDSTLFDVSDSLSKKENIENTYYVFSGNELENGKTHYFRVKAVNTSGSSAWSEIKSVPVGTTPTAPTTWSSTITATTDDSVTLYWVHNSEDNSDMTNAQLTIKIGDGNAITYDIIRTEEIQNGVSVASLNWQGASLSGATLSASESINACTIDCSSYPTGTTMQWKIRTAGVTNTLGEYSTERTINIYPKPTLSVALEDSEGNSIDTVTMFPFRIRVVAGPQGQVPIGYHVEVISNEAYETVDRVGNIKMVNAGEKVYSKNFDIPTLSYVEFSADNIDLEINRSYNISVKVVMNSGLSTTNNSISFSVYWTDEQYEPNAEIGIDRELVSAYIRPYCIDGLGQLIDGVKLAVYRREYDGSLTEIASNISNSKSTFVVDPHPALDYARYRIIATTESTGAVSYYDVPAYYVGEKSIIIQWSEKWTNFDVEENETLEQPSWSGSMLKLPYNIDVSNSYKTDSATVNYVGRKHPVGYHGTHLGESATWNVEIEKSDKETIYALRRLSVWMDNVYVREPSGTGYWAIISISFSQNHCEVTIPVTIEVTRVEGGI